MVEKSIVAGDFHFPFHDKKATRLFLRFLSAFKPNIVFLNGDITDCWIISSFVKPLNIQVRLRDELILTRGFLRDIRSRVGKKCKIFYIFGNHEYRFEKFISTRSPELAGLHGLTLEEQLGLSGLGIAIVNDYQRENYYQYGKLLIAHFNRVNKHSGYTAKNLLEDKGISLIQAHTHRGGSSFKRDYADTKVAYEGYCMCDLNPHYVARPNWQLGFNTIHKEKKTDFFKVTPVEIIKYKIIYGNKVYQ